MRLKDKIKALAIGLVTTVVTACGGGKSAPDIERARGKRADSGNTFLRVAIEEIPFVGKKVTYWGGCVGFPHTASEEEIRKGLSTLQSEHITDELARSGIAVEKKGAVNAPDSVLASVEQVDGKFMNPKYAANPVDTTEVMKQRYVKLEVTDGENLYVKRDVAAKKINQLDPKTVGVAGENVQNMVSERMVATRQAVENKKLAQQLKKGDKVEVDGQTYVVEKDGVSPTIPAHKEKSEREIKKIHFDYNRKTSDLEK